MAQPPPQHTSARAWDETAFHSYILEVFLVFAREACKFGKAQQWSLERIRREAHEFRRRFSIEAFYESGRDRYGQAFPEMHSRYSGALSAEMERSLRRSPPWQEFERELLAVVEPPSEPELERAAAQTATERRALVDGFLQRVQLDTGEKVTRKQMWQAAGHKTGRQFQFWQAGSCKSTTEDVRNFRRILGMNSKNFIEFLNKLGRS